MTDVSYFKPHIERQEAFAKALKVAESKGVKVLAYDCIVTPDSLTIHQDVAVKLD